MAEDQWEQSAEIHVVAVKTKKRMCLGISAILGEMGRRKMDKKGISKTVKKIVEKVMLIEYTDELFEMRLEDVGLDSFLLVRMVVLLEEEFHMSFSLKDFDCSQHRTFADLIDIIVQMKENQALVST